MICTSTLIFLFPSLCLHFHPFISLFLPVCLFLTSSSFMPSFTCFLSYSLELPAHTNSFKLAFPSFLPHFISLSVPWPGHVPSNQCLPLVPICMLPCCRCHFLALYPCERGRDCERERHGEKGEGQRRKARKQGNACRCRAYLVYKYANTVAFVICKWEITER